jgi:hypothetical protein
VRFASFLSSGFTTVEAVNPLEKKLAKHTSVHWNMQPLQPYLLKKLPALDNLIISGTKMTNTGFFCGINLEKSKFSLISDTISVRGC